MKLATTSRRALLRTLALASAVGPTLGRLAASTVHAQETTMSSADQALALLLDGNARYVSGTPVGPRRTVDRRTQVAGGQAPYATILSCADSRVPPELVFDAGLGDLFVHRVAGNVLNEELLGSIEYGAEHLHVPLIMVLGHERCGAVEATVQAATQGAQFDGHIPSLARAILPAVERVRGLPGDLVDNAIRANVALVVEQLTARSPLLAAMAQRDEVQIVGAYYSLQTGQVAVFAGPTGAGEGR